MPSGADVALDSGQQREAIEPRVHFTDRARVLERAALVESVRHRERLAVVGDGEVAQPRRLGGARHRFDAVPAVGRGGVGSADLPADPAAAAAAGACRPPRPRSHRGSRAAPAARTRGRAPRRHRLRRRRQSAVVVDAIEPVLVQLQSALDRAIAQRDVVGLGAGEILECGAEALARDDPQVGLEAAPEPDARFSVAMGEHALDEAVSGEASISGAAVAAGGQDVEIAARLAAAAEAADGHDLAPRARARAAPRRARRPCRAPRPSAAGR